MAVDGAKEELAGRRIDRDGVVHRALASPLDPRGPGLGDEEWGVLPNRPAVGGVQSVDVAPLAANVDDAAVVDGRRVKAGAVQRRAGRAAAILGEAAAEGRAAGRAETPARGARRRVEGVELRAVAGGLAADRGVIQTPLS